MATFSSLVYTATTDQEIFTLTASATGVTSVDANSVDSDVVATQLVFNTQPSPLLVISGEPTILTTVPEVSARDDNGTIDTGYNTAITLAEVNGTGSASISGTGDIDGNGATVTITPSSGVATFTGLILTYTAAGSSRETFNLRAGSGGLTTADSSQFATNPQEINVQCEGEKIADGGSYYFGIQDVGIDVDVIFTIENTGGADLTVDTSLSIDGDDTGQFSIREQPISPIEGSGSTTFTVRFSPTSVGAKIATISITNNDADENPYYIILHGGEPIPYGTPIPAIYLLLLDD